MPDFIVREDELEFTPPQNPYLDYSLYLDTPQIGETALHFDEEHDENETEEETALRLQKTVDGMFPHDGYDYSKHFRDPGEGLFIPASKDIYQPPQFAPKKGLEKPTTGEHENATLIGKASVISAALNQSSVNNSETAASAAIRGPKPDVRTILVKGARVLDDQLDPDIIAALESDDESDESGDEEEVQDNGQKQQAAVKSGGRNYRSRAQPPHPTRRIVKTDADDDYFENMLKQMNEGGQVDEEGNEFFVDEEFEEGEDYYDDDDEEYDGEYDDEDGEYGDEDGEFYDDEGVIDRQLQNREYFSKEKIDRLEAKKQLNSQFDYLMREEYGEDEEQEMEKYENLRSTMDNVAERLEGDLLDDFINIPENLRAHKAFFTDMTYEQAVKTIADADLRRIAENLPPDAILLTEETKPTAWVGAVLNSEIVDINLKRLEHNPKLGLEASDDEGEYEMLEVEDEEEQKRWDCETILTTYSNLENHPRLISESITLKGLAKKRKQQIQLSQKSGLPLNVIPTRQKQEEQVEDSEDEYTDEEEDANEGRARPKKETKEEKALRKKLVKQIKQEKRTQKKAMKEAFKNEEREQTKVLTQQQGSRKIIIKY